MLRYGGVQWDYLICNSNNFQKHSSAVIIVVLVIVLGWHWNSDQCVCDTYINNLLVWKLKSRLKYLHGAQNNSLFIYINSNDDIIVVWELRSGGIIISVHIFNFINTTKWP